LEKTHIMPQNKAFWIKPAALHPEIRAHVEGIRVVDTHEHLQEEAEQLKQRNNLTPFFMYYSYADLTAAGLPKEAHAKFFSEEISGEEQWQLIRKTWPKVRHSAFCKATILSIQELYGIEDLRDDTIGPLLKAVAERNKPGVTRWMLEEKCGLELCQVNANDPGDLARRTEMPGLFMFDIGVSSFCSSGMLKDIQKLEKASGISCQNLKDVTRLIDFYFERWGKQAVAIKNVCAYWRTLQFEDVPFEEAARRFDQWKLKGQDMPAADTKPVQDFLFHYCIQRCIDFDLTIKIHTGYLSGNNFMDTSLYQVKDMVNLYAKYQGARFDLIHLGYPHENELLALAKHYTNVYADMAWAWVIDPEASMNFLRRALVALPVNKLFGFGGDYGYADMVYGHARIARDGVSLVLSEAHGRGLLSVKEANEVASAWLRENAMETFQIEHRRKIQAAGQPAPLA
jgi:hypothetical protein